MQTIPGPVGAVISFTKITRSLALVVAFGSVSVVPGRGLGQVWVPSSAPPGKWSSAAASADAKTIAVIASDPSVSAFYTSTNGGADWITNNIPVPFAWRWRAVACSADGSRLTAGITGDPTPVLTSLDHGLTWISNNTVRASWISVACSGDARVQMACSFNNGLVSYSTNFGAAWVVADLPHTTWMTTSCSANGQTLAVAANWGPLYLSTDGGETWFAAPVPLAYWSSVALSWNGQRLAAASFGDGSIYTSSDFGQTWTSNNVPSLNWTAIGSSADGTTLLAAANGGGSGGPLYFSTNAGLSWVSSQSPIRDWRSVSVSADGAALAALAYNDMIYFSRLAPKPLLNILRDGSNVLISWTVSSTNLSLCSGGEPSSGAWLPVPTVPVLNATNLMHEVAVPSATSSQFFQLR